MRKPFFLSASITGLILIIFLSNSFFRPHETYFPFEIPLGFPTPSIPEDNQFTPERIALGKMLFYDPILSKDQTISCASCHKPEFGFGDNAKFSHGVNDSLTERNAMPLVNLAWVNMFFWDGGVPTLELQVMKPLTNPKEMNLPVLEAVKRLNANKKYVKLFKNAYGTKPDANSLFKAIACFERTLVSANSRFDQFYYKKNAMAFTDSEIRGYYLFMGSQMHCSSCHIGPNLGQNSFQNNGLYESYPDDGRSKVTGLESDKGKFKVPTLRNIALTAPYMHDGSIPTLELVVKHYVSGGKNHPNKSSHVHFPEDPPINDSQIKDLVNFLHTLTDENFIKNPAFLPDANTSK